MNLYTFYSFKKIELFQHNILPLKKNVQVQMKVYGHSCHAKHRCVQRKGTVCMYESLYVGHLFGTEIAVVVVRGQLDVGIVSYF